MTLTPILAGYVADLFTGHTVVLSDAYLNELTAHFNEADGPEANRWFRQLVTEPNPERVGVLDAYVCYLRDRQPELLALLRKGLSIGLSSEQAEALRVYKAGVDCSVQADIEVLDIRAANPAGMHTVTLHVRRNVSRLEFWGRRVMVYCNALGHWTVDYQDSDKRPCDSECRTDWTEDDALKVARAFVFSTRVADLDVTSSVISDLRAATHAAVMRGVKPAKGLTKPRAAVLLKVDGLCLEFLSNVLIYAKAFKGWGKTEHKMLLSLALAGYVRVVKVDGPLPAEYKVEGASTGCHYKLAVNKPQGGA